MNQAVTFRKRVYTTLEFGGKSRIAISSFVEGRVMAA